MYRFLDKMETQIGKVQSKRKKSLLCGDWNINFVHDSVQLQALQSVLSYNLTNTVTLPTRVTKNTSSLIDVMIMNKQYNNNSIEVVNLGYSNHFAQILCFLVNKQNNRMENITKRNFSRSKYRKF
jgi:exonuclease III